MRIRRPLILSACCQAARSDSAARYRRVQHYGRSTCRSFLLQEHAEREAPYLWLPKSHALPSTVSCGNVQLAPQASLLLRFNSSLPFIPLAVPTHRLLDQSKASPAGNPTSGIKAATWACVQAVMSNVTCSNDNVAPTRLQGNCLLYRL